MALEKWAHNWSSAHGATADDVAAQYHPDAEYWVVPMGTRTAGRDMRAHAELVFAACPDAVAEIRSRVDAGATTVIEWTWSGTFTGCPPPGHRSSCTGAASSRSRTT